MKPAEPGAGSAISAGDWTTRLLLDNIDQFWSPDADWVPEFLADPHNRDVARRQIDIGIRSRRPKQEWLAGRKIGTVRFAIYQSHRLARDAEIGWVGLVEDEAHFPTGSWIREHHGDDVTVTVNKAALALALVRQGTARMLLPMFVGEAFRDLQRISEPIGNLQTERWLVMHQDERHEPAVRHALAALAKMLKTDPTLRSEF